MPVAHGANPALDPDGFDLRMVPSAINWIFLSSLQILPPITSQIVTLAPLPTMKRFKDEGTTGNATPLPFSAMLVGGVIWCMYGRLTDDMTIMIPNVTTILFGIYYLVTFSRYRHPKTSLLLHVLGAIFVIVSVVSATFVLPHEDAVDMIGEVGSIQQVVMYSGPLMVIKTVIRDRNTSAMNAWFTVATFLSCSVWTLYGAAVTHDIYLWGPNVVGLVSSAPLSASPRSSYLIPKPYDSNLMISATLLCTSDTQAFRTLTALLCFCSNTSLLTRVCVIWQFAAAVQLFLFLKYGLPPPPHVKEADIIEGVPLKTVATE
mmetsp:Transcript_4875/g.11756  ORF Transcript_4875/g.11756 Transcript_4875/m.11756 type:complete len:318 (+) Transcript_4875:127-1080(+)